MVSRGPSQPQLFCKSYQIFAFLWMIAIITYDVVMLKIKDVAINWLERNLLVCLDCITVLLSLGMGKSQISVLVRFFLLGQHILSRVKEELINPPRTLYFLCPVFSGINRPLTVSKLTRSTMCEKFKVWEETPVPRVCHNLGFSVTPVLLLCHGCISLFRKAGM